MDRRRRCRLARLGNTARPGTGDRPTGRQRQRGVPAAAGRVERVPALAREVDLDPRVGPRVLDGLDAGPRVEVPGQEALDEAGRDACAAAGGPSSASRSARSSPVDGRRSTPRRSSSRSRRRERRRRTRTATTGARSRGRPRGRTALSERPVALSLRRTSSRTCWASGPTAPFGSVSVAREDLGRVARPRGAKQVLRHPAVLVATERGRVP